MVMTRRPVPGSDAALVPVLATILPLAGLSLPTAARDPVSPKIGWPALRAPSPTAGPGPGHPGRSVVGVAEEGHRPADREHQVRSPDAALSYAPDP